MDIREQVFQLKRKYQTNNIYEIIRIKKILLIYEELGSIRGYYNKTLRQKQIHINCNLDDQQSLFTTCHEFAHSTMHPDSNTPFLMANTYQSVDKLEIQANKFAVEFIIDDDTILEYVRHGYTVGQIANILGYHKELIDLRLK